MSEAQIIELLWENLLDEVLEGSEWKIERGVSEAAQK